MIHFNIAPYTGNELKYIKKAVDNHKICGDGEFTAKCSNWLQKQMQVRNVFLTTSCTHALEIAALMCDIKPGDEVIMPSYTFVSTGDAFVRLGAKIIFVDINPNTMNIDEDLAIQAITKRTKAIVPVHYAGMCCDMDKILNAARQFNIKVIEDAAQAVMSKYKGRSLGTLSDFGCYSFHETKNYSMGEGGAILFDDDNFREQVEIMREKGTNRSKYFRGQIDKYTWIDYGSSYLPSDINAAYLWAQLELADEIFNDRMKSWNYYNNSLKNLEDAGKLQRPVIPDFCTHNAHMYFIKTKDLSERTRLIDYFLERGIQAVFHYIPLHSSPAGKRFGEFFGDDIYTSKESERLLRLPIYYGMKEIELEKVVLAIEEFYSN